MNVGVKATIGWHYIILHWDQGLLRQLPNTRMAAQLKNVQHIQRRHHSDSTEGPRVP